MRHHARLPVDTIPVSSRLLQVKSIGFALLILQHQMRESWVSPVFQYSYPKAHNLVYPQHESPRVPLTMSIFAVLSKAKTCLPAAEPNVHSATLAVPPLLIASMVLSADGDRSWRELGHIVGEILSPFSSVALCSNGQETMQPARKSRLQNNSEGSGRAYSERQHVCIG